MKLSALLFLVACGGGGSNNNGTDGGVTVDSRQIDAPAAAVTVHVLDSTTLAGRPVAFLRNDDSVIAEVLTDSTGTASAPMPDGGSVTVGGTGVVNATVYTYVGVKNGQELTIGKAIAAAANPFAITVTIPASVEPTAQNFNFNSTCNINASNGTNSRTVDMMIRPDCTTADFYVEALDSSYKVLSTTYVTGKAVSAGANVNTGTVFTPVASTTLSITNAPLATITPALDVVVGSFYPVPVLFNSDITITNGNGTKKLNRGTIPGASLETRIQVQSSGDQFWVKRTAATDFEAFDFATANLPVISSGVAYSPTARAVTWDESGHAVDTSAADITVRNGSARNYAWLIVGPHTAASLHVPHLPGSLAQYNIASSDTVFPTAVIGSFPGGFDRIVSHAFIERFDFFTAVYAGDRRDAWGYVLADGDTAMFASNN